MFSLPALGSCLVGSKHVLVPFVLYASVVGSLQPGTRPGHRIIHGTEPAHLRRRGAASGGQSPDGRQGLAKRKALRSKKL